MIIIVYKYKMMDKKYKQLQENHKKLKNDYQSLLQKNQNDLVKIRLKEKALNEIIGKLQMEKKQIRETLSVKIIKLQNQIEQLTKLKLKIKEHNSIQQTKKRQSQSISQFNSNSNQKSKTVSISIQKNQKQQQTNQIIISLQQTIKKLRQNLIQTSNQNKKLKLQIQELLIKNDSINSKMTLLQNRNQKLQKSSAQKRFSKQAGEAQKLGQKKDKKSVQTQQKVQTQILESRPSTCSVFSKQKQSLQNKKKQIQTQTQTQTTEKRKQNENKIIELRNIQQLQKQVKILQKRQAQNQKTIQKYKSQLTLTNNQLKINKQKLMLHQTLLNSKNQEVDSLFIKIQKLSIQNNDFKNQVKKMTEKDQNVADLINKNQDLLQEVSLLKEMIKSCKTMLKVKEMENQKLKNKIS